jgi:hypothetical protein
VATVGWLRRSGLAQPFDLALDLRLGEGLWPYTSRRSR